MQQLTEILNRHFKEMCGSNRVLYRADVPGEMLWDAYMKGFAPDPIFRDPNSSEHNCNNCRHFIHHYGNLCIINDDNTMTSLFDIDVPEEYAKSIKAMADLVHSTTIRNVFVMTRDWLLRTAYPSCTESNHITLGIPKNVKRYTAEEAAKFGIVKPNQTITFHHLYLNIPARYILNGRDSIESISAEHLSNKQVFERAMNEFSVDTLELVKDLMEQNSILNGSAHLPKLNAIIPLLKEYKELPSNQKDAWLWKKSHKFQYAKFRNELVGVLCVDIQSGVALDKACRDWNMRVDPANYMKAASPITKRQIEDAQKFAEENGYIESFTRRCATMEDIEASEILHIHNGDVKPVSIFDTVKATKSTNVPDFKNVRDIKIEEFMSSVLPKCSSVELFFDNKHQDNLVTLITAENKDSKRMFRWNNNFSWTYVGNLSGKSEIKQAVKAAGGFVDAPFRFSIMWNEDGRSIVDFDAHAKEPTGSEIYFGNYRQPGSTSMGGTLDVDMIRPRNTGVENIFWRDINRVKDGVYRFWIHNYDSGHNTGCKAEIYCNGETYTYELVGNLQHNNPVANVTIKNGHIAKIEHLAPLTGSISANVYGLDTNQFHQVKLMCVSPNYWGSNVGNKHYFFFLDGCKATEKLRGFHNEFLNSDLQRHRKVLEVLAHSMKVESTDNQLSGLGFNATVEDEVIVRVKGEANGMYKIKF